MARQEMFTEKTADLWTQQLKRGMDTISLTQNQMEKLMSLWMDQIVEVQKETQKFAKEWMSCVAKGQAEVIDAFQENVKETTKAFTPKTAKEAQA